MPYLTIYHNAHMPYVDFIGWKHVDEDMIFLVYDFHNITLLHHML